MTAPNLELNDQLDDQSNQDGTDPIDSNDGGSNIEPQNTTPQTPAIDFAALYRQSLAERNRLDEELNNLRQQVNRPAPQDDLEITDDYFEKHGTARGVKTIVEGTVSKLLRETLGDVGEISQEFKRNKQIASAEEKFYQEFPNLIDVRDQLSGTVRQFLSNATNVDLDTYRKTALATIGALAAQSYNPSLKPSAPASNTPAKPVPSAPAPRSNGTPVRTGTRRLTEFERSAMRQAGFDPNKRESIDEFFAIVERDGPIEI